jgi:hypothetical protein
VVSVASRLDGKLDFPQVASLRGITAQAVLNPNLPINNPLGQLKLAQGAAQSASAQLAPAVEQKQQMMMRAQYDLCQKTMNPQGFSPGKFAMHEAAGAGLSIAGAVTQNALIGACAAAAGVPILGAAVQWALSPNDPTRHAGIVHASQQQGSQYFCSYTDAGGEKHNAYFPEKSADINPAVCRMDQGQQPSIFQNVPTQFATAQQYDKHYAKMLEEFGSPEKLMAALKKESNIETQALKVADLSAQNEQAIFAQQGNRIKDYGMRA